VSILATARALMALLQPLTGARSTGSATVKAAPGPEAVLPANAYAVPIVGGAMRFDLLLRVDQNPADDEGWTVDTVGVPVTVTSLLGGVDVNLAAGTEIRWWPTRADIEPKSVLATPLAGGTQLTGIGALAQVGFFEQLQASLTGAAADLFKSMVSRFPSAVLVWEGSGPADGATVSPLEQGGSRVGRGIHLYAYEWDLFVVTSRQDSDPARREEGLALVDAITEQIVDKQTVDGVPFSAPTGVQIIQRSRWLVTPTFYVYRIRLSTVSSVKARDPRTWNPWLLTRLDVDTPEPLVPAPGPLPLVDDNRFPMPT